MPWFPWANVWAGHRPAMETITLKYSSKRLNYTGNIENIMALLRQNVCLCQDDETLLR